VDVDAAVLEEPPVLGRDDRLLHHGRDLVRVDQDTRLRAAQHREDALPARVVDVAVLLEAVARPRRVELRQLAADPHHQPVREGHEAEQTHQEQEGEEAKLADAATALAVRLNGRPTGQNSPILAGVCL
jgi:hypothetical protein